MSIGRGGGDRGAERCAAAVGFRGALTHPALRGARPAPPSAPFLSRYCATRVADKKHKLHLDLGPGTCKSVGTLLLLRRHAVNLQELKHLYTAITRAKNNIIIFDRSPEKRAPFFQYLRRRGLARVVRKCASVSIAE